MTKEFTSKLNFKTGTLFSGAGGFDYYFHDVFDIRFASDILNAPAQTYQKNHGFQIKETINAKIPTYVLSDITNVDFRSVGKLDVVIGGPPCQDFSVIRGDNNRKGITVTRGKLYQQYIRVLNETNPDVFVFENVPGLISANNGLAYKTILNDLSKRYHILFSNVVDSSHFGVPQKRKRLIILGAKISQSNVLRYKQYCNMILSGERSIFKKFPLSTLEIFEGKPITQLQNRYETIMSRYDDLVHDTRIPAMSKFKTNVWDKLTFDVVQDYLNANQIYDRTDFDIAIIQHKKILEEYTQNVRDIKDHSNTVQNEKPDVFDRMYHIPPDQNHEFVKGTKWEIKTVNMSNIYRRLHPLKPAYTVIAHGGGGTWSYHYERDRGKLTNRERARLQTFPDSYKFEGNVQQVRSQIGEAVPALLGKIISDLSFQILTGTIKSSKTGQLFLDDF